MPPSAPGSILGTLALVLGLVAFAAAVLHFFLGPVEAPPTLEEVVAERAVGIRDAVVARLTGEAPEPRAPRADPRMGIDRMIDRGVVIGGLLAIALAAFGVIRRGDRTVNGFAAALGAGAVAFQFAVVALSVLVLGILLAAVLQTMDGWAP